MDANKEWKVMELPPKQMITTLSSGDFVMQWPATINSDDLSDMMALTELQFRVLERQLRQNPGKEKTPEGAEERN